ncbi:MAG: hypothetical protein JXR18_14050 [Neptuniibacter sp.]
MPFFVPEGWDRYHRQIKTSIETLIRQNILSGISPTDLVSWYGNFKTSEERYLAAHLLDSMVFRSEEMLKSTCRHILVKILPDLLPELDCQSICELRRFLSRRTYQPRVVFSTVPADKPGKSGDQLLRLFMRETGTNNDYKRHAHNWTNYPNSVVAMVLIDDMVGTGTQFSNFYKKHQLSSCPFRVIYIPLFAHSDGIEAIEKNCPSVELYPVEILGKDHDFFREDKKSPGFGIWAKDQKNTVGDVRSFYLSLLRDRGISIGDPFGYGDLGLTVYTHMSSPNNSLHSFYTNKNMEQWVPLLKR